MKKIHLIILLISCFIFNTKASSLIENNLEINAVSLNLVYQSGSGLIKAVEIGDFSNQFYSFRIRLHPSVERVRIDWQSGTKTYIEIYTPSNYSNYVDIPYFSTDKFIISVEATNISADMSDISYRYEAWCYTVIR